MPYCVQADVEHVLTTEGVVWTSADQELDAETVIVNDIARAGTVIDQYLSDRYSAAVLEANQWVRWAAATIAARYLSTRGGNPVPNGIQVEYDRVIEFMTRIQAGVASLAGAAELRIPGVAMSNVQVDSRFSQQKIRVVPVISIGEASSKFPRSVMETVPE